ncbi:MFS transporter [Limibaculum sp. M0105]|uniref:MFS transporter n=1 Tax=Thermohalobaculum xanthum TaxID=2753746 RepID=A0A8J7SFR5_9RHOB|nr:MFS transporter [Thermohalobaculum xanthum]MBK0398615.1 MFS transporter [Thermohalobaculum xanthum]
MPQPAVPVGAVDHLPRWRRPETLLMLMAIASPLAFATWMALLNNFVVEKAAFDGFDIGVLHVAREIPGFLAFLVVWILLIMREQLLAYLSLILLGLGTAITGEFPSFWGLMITTTLSSVGFHYFETINQSLQLQWLPKEHAPRAIGRIVAAGSFGSLVVFGLIIFAWRELGLSYSTVYWAAGLACAAIAAFCWIAFPRFEAPVIQNKQMVLRRRYWLYYALIFIGGARRQIFVVFAPFMMVERFDLKVHEVTGLMLVNYIAVMLFAPYAGRLIQRLGESTALKLEYVGLLTVFSLYAGIYFFEWSVWLAMALYVADHMLFSLAIAHKTYFQKIADPADQAPTAAVAFTINHIAAVTLPAPLGLLWLAQPGAVFALAAALAIVSLGLAFLVPRHPQAGNETLWRPRPSAMAQPGE